MFSKNEGLVKIHKLSAQLGLEFCYLNLLLCLQFAHLWIMVIINIYIFTFELTLICCKIMTHSKNSICTCLSTQTYVCDKQQMQDNTQLKQHPFMYIGCCCCLNFWELDEMTVGISYVKTTHFFLVLWLPHLRLFKFDCRINHYRIIHFFNDSFKAQLKGISQRTR